MRATVPDLSKFPGAGAYDTTGDSGAAGESASDHPSNFPSSSSPYNAAGAFSASHYGGFEGLKLQDRAARAAPAAPVSYLQIPGVRFTQHPANGFQQNAAPLAPASQVPYKLQYEARLKALAEAAKKEQQGAPQAHYQYPVQHPPQVQPPPPYETQYHHGQCRVQGRLLRRMLPPSKAKPRPSRPGCVILPRKCRSTLIAGIARSVRASHDGAAPFFYCTFSIDLVFLQAFSIHGIHRHATRKAGHECARTVGCDSALVAITPAISAIAPCEIQTPGRRQWNPCAIKPVA